MSEGKFFSDKTKGEIRTIPCGTCHVPTRHKVGCSIRHLWGNDDIQGADDYEILRCEGCESISFRSSSSNSDDYHIDDEGEYHSIEQVSVFPPRLAGRPALRDIWSLPKRVSTIYRETHVAVCSGLKIIAGIGIRALVEAICKENGAERGDLKEKIDDLVEKGILTAANAAVLHQTRFLGNSLAHEMIEPRDEELGVAFDIVEGLLSNIYIIPQKAEMLARFDKKPPKKDQVVPGESE